MGRVVVHLHGSSRNAAFKSAITDYANRLNSSSVTLVEHSDKTSAEEYLKQISRHAGEAQITLLMEAGKETDSIAFGELYATWRCLAPTPILWSAPRMVSEKLQVTIPLSLSKMTMQHELAAVVLLEQLYRAAAMHEGKPYHRG
ncbi:MAG: ribosomal RNA large subunit methyltransferase H [Candidatus Poseidoniales archaeon]|nr:MAG: ribosomal RNA large subunit methyltransferase H [Candidatus Poseidoniales archaeon]